MKNYVRFDWAMKRLLRDKANYDVLEGFLSTLLDDDIHIHRFLESESNQSDMSDKFNRVDILAEDCRGQLIIIEVQNTRELDYFHRMLYGTSKAIVEYIKLGDEYGKIRKLYSINIVYFDLGQGRDYVYHGKTHFYGLHDKTDELRLSPRQMETFKGRIWVGDIFPEYYVLRVDKFNDVARTPLDEWVSFLKTGEIEDSYTAKGLSEAREKLRVTTLSDAERVKYYRDMDAISYQRSVIGTGWFEGHAEGVAEGRAEGLAEGRIEGQYEKAREIALKLKWQGLSSNVIADATGLSVDEIEKL